jgi:Sulfatase
LNHDLWLNAQNMFLKAFPYPPYTVEAIWRHDVVLQRMKEMIGRFDVNLIYLHIMLPHKPIIFNGKTGKMTPFNYSPWGYYDNLALTDKFLGEFRNTLENAGLWESTTVLVTSDHPWRKAKKYTGKRDRRVPLLLKAPYQQEAVFYEHEFLPMRVKDLVLQILDGHLVDPNTITTWLKQR